MINGTKIGSFIAHQSKVNYVNWHKEDKFILSCSHDKSIKIWNVDNFELVNLLFHGSYELHIILLN